MRKICLLVLFNAFVSGLQAQNGFRVIEKAGRAYASGNPSKALKLLDKAEGMNYGFCGNAWAEANQSICRLRYEIFVQQGNYLQARKSLDSMSWETLWNRGDSLRIRTYLLQYGADSLRSMITSTTLEQAAIDCGTNDCYVNLPLSNGQCIRLRIIFEYVYSPEWSHEQLLEHWIAQFRESPDYRLLFAGD